MPRHTLSGRDEKHCSVSLKTHTAVCCVFLTKKTTVLVDTGRTWYQRAKGLYENVLVVVRKGNVNNAVLFYSTLIYTVATKSKLTLWNDVIICFDRSIDHFLLNDVELSRLQRQQRRPRFSLHPVPHLWDDVSMCIAPLPTCTVLHDPPKQFNFKHFLSSVAECRGALLFQPTPRQ